MHKFYIFFAKKYLLQITEATRKLPFQKETLWTVYLVFFTVSSISFLEISSYAVNTYTRSGKSAQPRNHLQKQSSHYRTNGVMGNKVVFFCNLP